MLFVLDAGNSNTVLGLYEDETFHGHWRLTTAARTADEWRILFSMLLREEGVEPSAITGCCISSVVPPLNDALLKACRACFNVEPLLVGPGVKTGLVLQCENPKEVGADRIVNSVSARAQFEGPLIVIDFGTATTFDAVTANGEWRGGVIVPGIRLSADALFDRCAKLPRVEIATPDHVIGRNTINNMKAGLTYGYADMTDGLVRRIRAEMEGEPTVVATGGLAPIIAEVAETIDHIDPWLTLNGLRIIHEKNQKRLSHE